MPGRPVAGALRSELLPVFGNLVARARLHSGRAPRFLTDRLRADAFVLGRRVFLSRRAEEELERRSHEAVALLAHELAHVAQYRRHGMPGFLARYVGEYLRRRLGGCSHAEAYRGISFEREAEDAEQRFVSARGLPGSPSKTETRPAGPHRA